MQTEESMTLATSITKKTKQKGLSLKQLKQVFYLSETHSQVLVCQLSELPKRQMQTSLYVIL